MSRRKKKPHGHRANNSPPLTDAQKDAQLVRETAEIFTASSKMTHDFVHQCDIDIERLDVDLDFNRLAIEMWRGRPGHVESVTAALADLLAARQRHQAEVTAIRNRLVDLMAVPHDEHLHPVEDWLPIVRKHIIHDTAE